MKELFLVVYLMATPDGGGSFPTDGLGHIKTFNGPTALVECVDLILNIQRNWPGALGRGIPDFYCVPKGD